ncbi:MAG TPA: hypothetical protein VFX43_09590 [Chitinophagaceae bacterium]|nr:hypothetical protein [Chitinophagaceae bacterium]
MAKYFAITILSLTLLYGTIFAQDALPVGSHPPAIEFNYFPNKVYAVIWRNWNLVDPERIARTIGCNAEDVKAIAASMGLPPAATIPEDYKKRMFITILRRNWQLLPYDQLLRLLDMSREQLALALREDDFLFIKLGGLKPKCSRVVYHLPGIKAKARAGEIKRLVKRYFKDKMSAPAEPRFSFVKEFSAVHGLSKSEKPNWNNAKGLRFIYSDFALFGDPLMDASIDPYPDGLLERYAAEGVNGVWLPVVLNQMAPGGKYFPEFGAGYRKRLANLQGIVTRAKKYGIKVYLYLNEPRAMPASFFKNRQEMAGVREGDLVAMCTSDSEVTEWMRHALTYIFKQVSGLGGVFTITASENLTNCASHGHWNQCPRCSKRSYADIIAGVNKVITEGVHEGNPNARVIVWDWGWNDAHASAIIAALPKSDWLMSVSEWAKSFERGGITSSVGEYSMSVVGPGPRARQHWAMAKKAGLKTVAKVQFNNSWELSAVPWIPALDLVARHAANLATEDIDGTMLSWSLGGYPSLNLKIARIFEQNPDARTGAVLDTLAVGRYGKAAAPYAREAWTNFSKAFEQFPYSAGVLYKAPQQYGPSNLLFAKPTGYKASMVGFPYDDLQSWRDIYPSDVFAAQFDKVATIWKQGLVVFKKAVSLAGPGKKKIAKMDEGVARAAWLHFASVANQIHFILDRDSLLAGNSPETEKTVLKRRIGAILDNEMNLAVQLFDISRKDSRIGFEASNQYYYVPQDLMEKVIDCAFIRQKLCQ